MTLDQIIAKVAASRSDLLYSFQAMDRKRALEAVSWFDADAPDGASLAAHEKNLHHEINRQNAIRRRRRERQRGGDTLAETTLRERHHRLLTKLGLTGDANRGAHRTFATQDKGRRYIIPGVAPAGHVAYVKGVERVDEDWDYYSKSWHRSHGPKRTVTDRYVVLGHINLRTGAETEVSRTDEYVKNGFRGDWLLSSAARLLSGRLPHGVSVAPRWQSERGSSLRRVQLHQRARVEKMRSIGNVRVYRRTLASVLIDYCAVQVNERGTVQETYHASTPLEAVQGMRQKLRAAEEAEEAKARGELITWSLLRGLGFCKPGIRSAAAALGVSTSETITADALAERVHEAPHALRSYAHELRTLAKHIGREDLIRQAEQHYT